MKSQRVKIAVFGASVLTLIGIFLEFYHKPRQWQLNEPVNGIVEASFKQPRTIPYMAMVRLEDHTTITIPVPMDMILTPGQPIVLQHWTHKTDSDKHKYEIQKKLRRR